MVSKVIVIGAGATGSFITHDLASRGFDVTVIEKGNIIGGTSGKFHGMLHSGARYAMNDVKAAQESIADNKVISEIAPFCIENTGGLFVALNEEDLSFQSKFEDGCKQSNIPIENLSIESALKEEPFLNNSVKAVYRVPDKVINSFRFITSLLLTAKRESAKVLLNTEVLEFIKEGNDVKGVKIKNNNTGQVSELKADLVVNASGAWASKLIDEKLGIKSIEMILSAGTMAVINRRFTKHIINRLREPSDGDIVVPFFNDSIIGTTAFIVDDPEKFDVDKEDISFLQKAGSEMLPILANYPVYRYYAGVRPLIAAGENDDSRKASRDFKIFDHSATDNVNGIISIVGGKLSTARIMAKEIGDFIGNKMGNKTESKTDKIKLYWPQVNSENIDEMAKSLSLNKDFLSEMVNESAGKTYSDMYSNAMDLLYSRGLFN
ncbi:MAG: FAD-dependent oxidoreductase [Candidatus Parvarchaeota archaeon]|nr:FAD-dependent oxidoreductase [Candidatus Parvarchaeota archaeon]MCW1295342.1 FAD-dependent oxidoreductase [Candidatus Parvarchaeum tengchongense]MCW1299055.1 FAD-dependent oxidoreductase [Candidatus Parvarchaeum tengchongense]MCW1311992.1 FAD-dependent oxidoreductase [Candidatus Parvarchaeum tengchongense]